MERKSATMSIAEKQVTPLVASMAPHARRNTNRFAFESWANAPCMLLAVLAYFWHLLFPENALVPKRPPAPDTTLLSTIAASLK